MKAVFQSGTGTSGTQFETKEAVHPKSQFTKEQLDRALLDCYDLMQRVLLNTQFVVVGDAARCLYENRGLDCDSIDVVISNRFVTREARYTFAAFVKGTIMENGFNHSFEGVPVRCRYVEGDYPWFRYADQRLYGPEVYRIPNNFEEYWEVRDQFMGV